MQIASPAFYAAFLFYFTCPRHADKRKDDAPVINRSPLHLVIFYCFNVSAGHALRFSIVIGVSWRTRIVEKMLGAQRRINRGESQRRLVEIETIREIVGIRVRVA
jgi:hypothetical protein